MTTFNILRSTTSGEEVLLEAGVTTTSFVDATVTPGVTYYYQVVAVSPSGNSSSPSNEASITASS